MFACSVFSRASFLYSARVSRARLAFVIARARKETRVLANARQDHSISLHFEPIFTTVLDTASSGAGERIRRNSDSTMYFRPKEEAALLKVKHAAETELKFHRERIAVIEKELGHFCPEILETCTLEEKATFLTLNKMWKGEIMIML